jgi:hypothetical protein
MFCECCSRAVTGVELIQEISLQSIPIPAVDHLTLVTEVIQDIGGVRAQRVHLRVATFVLGRDVGNMIGQLDQLITAIVRLTHNALPRFSDVMLESYYFFEAELFAKLSGYLHGLVIHLIRPVETDQRGAAILA